MKSLRSLAQSINMTLPYIYEYTWVYMNLTPRLWENTVFRKHILKILKAQDRHPVTKIALYLCISDFISFSYHR